jgi:hypothetical protein
MRRLESTTLSHTSVNGLTYIQDLRQGRSVLDEDPADPYV